MNFHVGQHVVCVDDQWPPPQSTENLPVKGHVYTVRALGQFLFRGGEFAPALLLSEVVNPISAFRDGDVCEPMFWVERFRPVHKTDISIFERMLAPRPTEVVE